jgi:hypothetical protein
LLCLTDFSISASQLFPSPLSRTNERDKSSTLQLYDITVMFCIAVADRPYKTPFSLAAFRNSDFVSSRENNAEPVASFCYELATIIMIHVYQRIGCVTLCGWCLPRLVAMKTMFSKK